MTTEQNKALARRWVEAFEKGDKAAFDRLCDPNLVDHTAAPGMPPTGLAGIRANVDLYQAAFSGMRFTIENVIAEGDHVAINYVATLVQTGPLPGLPPTGKSATMAACNILHIAHGIVTEHWVYFDRLALMEQLGASIVPQR